MYFHLNILVHVDGTLFDLKKSVKFYINIRSCPEK